MGKKKNYFYSFTVLLREVIHLFWFFFFWKFEINFYVPIPDDIKSHVCCFAVVFWCQYLYVVHICSIFTISKLPNTDVVIIIGFCDKTFVPNDT